MATSAILLPMGAAILPDGSSGNAAPQVERIQGTETNPKKHFIALRFDASTEEFVYWTFQLPHSAAAAPTFTLRLICTAIASTGATAIVWGARIGAVTPTDADTPIEHAPAAQRTVTVNNNTTEAGRAISATITFTNAQADGVVPDDWVELQVSRTDLTGADTLAEDARLISAALDFDLA